MRRDSRGPTRHRRQHRNLIGIGDEIGALGGFAVAPDPARRQHLGEDPAVALRGAIEHLSNGDATESLSAGARSLSSCGEESERGHEKRLGVHRPGATALRGAVPSPP